MNHREFLIKSLSTLTPIIEIHKQIIDLEAAGSLNFTLAELGKIKNTLAILINSNNTEYVRNFLLITSSQPNFRNLLFKYSLIFCISFNSIELLRSLAAHSPEHLYYANSDNAIGVQLPFEISIKDHIRLAKDNQFALEAQEILAHSPSSPYFELVLDLIYQRNMGKFVNLLVNSDNSFPTVLFQNIALELINKGMESFYITPSPDTIKFVALARYMNFSEPQKPCELYATSFPNSAELGTIIECQLRIEILNAINSRINGNNFACKMITDTQTIMREALQKAPDELKSSISNYLQEGIIEFDYLKDQFKQATVSLMAKSIPNFSHTTTDQKLCLINSTIFFGANQSDNLAGAFSALSLFNELVGREKNNISLKYFASSAANLAVYLAQKVALRPSFSFDLETLSASCLEYMFSKSSKIRHLAADIFDDVGAGYIFEKIIKMSEIKAEGSSLQNQYLM